MGKPSMPLFRYTDNSYANEYQDILNANAPQGGVRLGTYVNNGAFGVYGVLKDAVAPANANDSRSDLYAVSRGTLSFVPYEPGVALIHNGQTLGLTYGNGPFDPASPYPSLMPLVQANTPLFPGAQVPDPLFQRPMPAYGTLVLQVDLFDKDNSLFAQTRLPSTVYALYHNVSSLAFVRAMEELPDLGDQLPREALEQYWLADPAHGNVLPTDNADLKLRYYYYYKAVTDGFMVAVEAGDCIGKVGPDPDNATSGLLDGAFQFLCGYIEEGANNATLWRGYDPRRYFKFVHDLRADEVAASTDNPPPANQWAGHPLMAKPLTGDFSYPNVDFFLKFEVFDDSPFDYVPVQNNTGNGAPPQVELWAVIDERSNLQDNPASAVLACPSATLGPDGRVHLVFQPRTFMSNLGVFDINSPMFLKFPRFFFKLSGIQMTIDGNTRMPLPSEWHTVATLDNAVCWESVEGLPGLWDPSAHPTGYGTLDTPEVFRVGLDFHVGFFYDPQFDATMSVAERAASMFPETLKMHLATSYQNGVWGTAPLPDNPIEVGGINHAHQESLWVVHSGLINNIDSPNPDINFSGVIFDFDAGNGLRYPIQPGWDYFWVMEPILSNNAVMALDPPAPNPDRLFVRNGLQTQGITTFAPGGEFNYTHAIILNSDLKSHWCSTFPDRDRLFYPRQTYPTIGDHQLGSMIVVQIVERAMLLHCLKTYLEMFGLVEYLVGEDLPNISFYLNLEEDSSGAFASFRANSVTFLANRAYWNRTTLAHEIGHTIHRNLVEQNSLHRAWEDATARPGGSAHYADEVTNPFFALVEGWAEFWESLFGGNYVEPSLDFVWTRHFPWDPLINPDYWVLPLNPREDDRFTQRFFGPNEVIFDNDGINTGLLVEGAVANVLNDVFWEFVAPATVRAGAPLRIVPSRSGVLAQSNPWLNAAQEDDISSHFVQLIWDPFSFLDDDEPISGGTAQLIGRMYDAARGSANVPQDVKPHMLSLCWSWNMGLGMFRTVPLLPYSSKVTGIRYEPATRQLVLDGHLLAGPLLGGGGLNQVVPVLTVSQNGAERTAINLSFTCTSGANGPADATRLTALCQNADGSAWPFNGNCTVSLSYVVRGYVYTIPFEGAVASINY